MPIAVAPDRAAAASRAPVLTGVRCVPATAAACRGHVAVRIGRQVQVRGTRLVAGMRVTFRWHRGALATKLKRSSAGWVVRVPAGVRAGTVSVTVTDRGRRRSNARRITVVAPPPVRVPVRPKTAGGVPDAFSGHGMWIWQLPKTEGGNVDAIAARAAAAGIRTVFIKGADGTTPWGQFTPELAAGLKARGLRVCAWQFVYGTDPLGEAQTAAAAIGAGADCFVIDAESHYDGKYAAAQQYVGALRAAVGPSYPVGLTSFPYVDYHPRLPYSVFLAPGAAQVNLPQVYWKDIGATVDAASARTFAHNRIYGAPIAPLGQTYQDPSPEDLQRFRQVWGTYGAAGLSWWSWQASTSATWTTLAQPAPAPDALPDPGWPALGKGAKGDQVVWLQQHLASADPSVPVDGKMSTQTIEALKSFQNAHGIPPTGTTDAVTWQAALALPPRVVDWTQAQDGVAKAARRRKAEIPELGRGG
jgi:hypothetical protein